MTEPDRRTWWQRHAPYWAGGKSAPMNIMYDPDGIARKCRQAAKELRADEDTRGFLTVPDIEELLEQAANEIIRLGIIKQDLITILRHERQVRSVRFEDDLPEPPAAPSAN
jgi:hypothetical protein